jgi:hypothetical protein
VNRLNLQRGVGGFYSPPGECAERECSSYWSGACVGAVSGDAACGHVRLVAVDEKEMVQPLESVQVEL